MSATTPSRLPRFAVVDVETSGLSTRRHRLLQVGVVIVEDQTVVDQWSTLIRLRWPLQRLGPRRVHGLRRSDFKDAPKIDVALRDLATRLEGSVFTAHNAQFDAGFIERAARRSGVTIDLQPRICTLMLSRRLDPEREQSHRLADLCERYGVVNGRPHDALADAMATSEVLPQLLAAHGIEHTDQLEPLYDRR